MKLLTFSLILIFCISVFAQKSEEDIAREKILNQYGNKQDYERKQKMAAEREVRVKKLEDYRAIVNKFNQTQQFYNNEDIQGLTKNERLAIINQKRAELSEAQIIVNKQEVYLNEGMESVFKQLTGSPPVKNILNKNVAKNDSFAEDGGDLMPSGISPEQMERIKSYATAQMNGTNNGTGIDSNMFTNMMSPEMKSAASQMMMTNYFSSMNKEELRRTLRERIEGSKIGSMVLSKPKFFDALVEVAHDDKAIPSFISIINKPALMKKYGIIVLSVTIFAFILNLMNSKANLIKRIFIKFGIMFTGALINFATFYFMFKENLDPAIAAIKRIL